LVEGSTGRVVGTVDADSAHGTAHAGAVYVHRGETWLVDSLDLHDRVAVIDRADVATPRPRASSPRSRSTASWTIAGGERPGSASGPSRSGIEWCPTCGVDSPPER
jgi:ATP-dependent helicase YprA (DUF1998 family)